MSETRLIFRTTDEGVTISLDTDADVDMDDPAFRAAMGVLIGLHDVAGLGELVPKEEAEDGVQ